MKSQKIYAGVKLREARLKTGMTQKEFAGRLDVSVSYLNQMERNHRPLSAGVVLKLVQEFDFDVGSLSAVEADKIVVELSEALADPLFGPIAPHEQDLRLVASNAPAVAHAMLSLYRAHRETSERFAALNEALGVRESDLAATPWEQVRDFFHYCDNYIDSIDRVAENFSQRAGLNAGNKLAACTQWLAENHGIETVITAGPLRRLDKSAKRLYLDQNAGAASQVFQMAHQIALLEHDDLLGATLDLAGFQSDETRAVAKIGLANYFAGAAVLPYGLFLDATQRLRHDLEALSLEFGASIEQVAQRLSTMQRPNKKGVPFFFVRVDQAGTITKRHSATKLQFARYGGACPLWNVHRAFEAPGQFLRQLAETPDSVRYLCLARDVSKSGSSFHAPAPRYAIGLGCEIKHADALVYADDLSVDNRAAFEPIGVSCRICDRSSCHQRALPPLKRELRVNHDLRDGHPYSFRRDDE